MVGGGGHAVVVMEAALAAGWAIAGYYDDDAHARLEGSAPRLGITALVSAADDREQRRLILALGQLDTRARLVRTIHGPWAIVAHPRAWVSLSAKVGEGTFIGAGAVVQGRAVVGSHVIVNTGAIVEHDCRVGDHSHVAPRAVLGGDVTVGAGTLIGLGATVLPGVRIGDGCTIGTGAAVIRDVPDGVTIVGVPGRRVG